jgi:hypothetical protein
MLPKYNNVNQTKESESLALDLETLNSKYNNLLVRYKQATIDYIQNLKIEANKPCGKYSANNLIDESCYMDIWAKSGCTTGNQDPAGTWWPKQTLNTLIYDSWLWATSTDNTHRMGCYSSNEGSYMIIGVGTNGELYSKSSLTASWIKVNDNITGCLGICRMNDGQGLLGIGSDGTLYSKPTLTATEWQPLSAVNGRCCVIAVEMAQDGSILGVGFDNKIWTKTDINADWQQNPDQGEWLTDICIAPNGSLFCIGGGNTIWKKDSYKNLNVGWTYQGDNNCCVKSITIAPDGTFLGVGTDSQMYYKKSYTDLTTAWIGPIESSCCVNSITTIANPNYSPAMYNTTIEPNYNLEKPPLTSVQGTTFWGTTPINQINGGSLEDCVASCSKTTNCTGATYNQYDHGQPICWLRGGDGSITSGLGGDYAIVPKSKELLQIVNSINTELTSLNQEIQSKIKDATTMYGSQSHQRSSQNSTLIIQNEQLQKEREIVNKTLQKYETLDNVQNESSLYITKNYYIFYILVFIAIIGCIVLAMFTLNKETTDAIKFNISNSADYVGKIGNKVNLYYLMLGIILVILIVTIYNDYSQNVYSGILSISKKMSKKLFIFIIIAFVAVFITLNYLQSK